MRVVVNAAMSVDGKLSTHRREQVAISGPADFERVDRLRADSDAVMVGVGTVLADDPSLTLDDPNLQARRKAADESPHPARVVADSTLRMPPDASILDDRAQTYVLTSDAASDERMKTVETPTTDVIQTGDERVALEPALERLETLEIEQLMVEGGGELIYSLFEEGLVDELSVFVGPEIIGGRTAPTLADGDGFVEAFPELSLDGVETVDEGVLLRWQVHTD